MAHKLNQCVLYPSSIQRSSTKLSLAVFHESTYNALTFFAESDVTRVAFVKVIHTLWTIINVKTSSVGARRRNSLQYPISGTEGPRLLLLQQYAAFFIKSTNKSGMLTKETNAAAILMCNTYVKMRSL
jgi:hypothetical protein